MAFAWLGSGHKPRVPADVTAQPARQPPAQPSHGLQQEQKFPSPRHLPPPPRPRTAFSAFWKTVRPASPRCAAAGKTPLGAPGQTAACRATRRSDSEALRPRPGTRLGRSEEELRQWFMRGGGEGGGRNASPSGPRRPPRSAGAAWSAQRARLSRSSRRGSPGRKRARPQPRRFIWTGASARLRGLSWCEGRAPVWLLPRAAAKANRARGKPEPGAGRGWWWWCAGRLLWPPAKCPPPASEVTRLPMPGLAGSAAALPKRPQPAPGERPAAPVAPATGRQAQVRTR